MLFIKVSLLLETMLRMGEFSGMRREEKDRFLKEELGIYGDRLSGLRSGSPYSRLERAVEAVYYGKEGKGKRERLALLTEDMLSYLIGMQRRQYSPALRERYGKNRDELKAGARLDPPYIELLRHDVSGERLPFLKERKHWKRFVPGRNDWRRDVTLPTPPFNRSESQMVGVIYGDGYIANHGCGLYLSGIGGDEAFYNVIVAPRLAGLFNLPMEVEIREDLGDVMGRKAEGSYPRIIIGSKAIATWLTRDLRFPKPNPKNRGRIRFKLPIDYSHREGLLEGIVASMGAMWTKNRPYLSIQEKDSVFADSIKSLANSLGMDPTLSTVRGIHFGPTKRLQFKLRDVNRISFINPRHVPF